MIAIQTALISNFVAMVLSNVALIVLAFMHSGIVGSAVTVYIVTSMLMTPLSQVHAAMEMGRMRRS